MRENERLRTASRSVLRWSTRSLNRRVFWFDVVFVGRRLDLVLRRSNFDVPFWRRGWRRFDVVLRRSNFFWKR